MNTVTLVEDVEDENVLPFNPCSKKQDCFIEYFTPAMARHILVYHNKDNRPITMPQVKKICDNIVDEGILFDGKAVTFNIEGNITEKQHFLTWLSEQPEATCVKLPVVTGVDPGTFSKAHPDKPRTYVDEIHRVYDKERAPKKQIATLADLIKRTKYPNIRLNNGVKYWNDWSDDIKYAAGMTKSLWDNTTKFNSQTKTLNAWATFCVRYKLEAQCKIVLKLLEDEIRHASKSTKLTSGALNIWQAHASDMPNDKRMDFLFAILCTLTDKVENYPKGTVELSKSVITLTNKKKLKGCFRTFTK